MSSNMKYWHPYISPFDPCPPVRVKRYNTPPNLYMGFQPYGLEQFSPREALHRGTLWPALFSPYESPVEANMKKGMRE
ncbi:spore coat associated protein CotJA [Pseudalkalibacillus caeni]|uniref:Spore coat associated protein CotJA n=1 Tax=Exobacillus caeni TaxID=2574798 RepID=A0A5R9FBG4_9BACL|nr:spore coat associated protein CotJA [Pseudalkalibacillus caeni]TLS37884.1 spore coat associated protein CotJA [Pseudalkalibacillus caeni]